jgi:membrane protease YdiL (CAAX protease family)
MSRPLKEVLTYLVIAFGLALGLAVAMPHAGINVILSAMAPVTAVLAITAFATPRGKRRALWGSFGLRRSGRSAWAVACFVPLLLATGAYAVAVAVGVADLRSFDLTVGGMSLAGANLLTSLLSMTVIFLGEEIGWRGYLLPRVQQLTSRRRAALVTGFIHGCFHLPLILIATTYDEFGSRWIVAPVVVATLTMGGVFYAYLWDRTGSVWPVSMAHGAVNIAFGLGAAAVVTGSEADLAYVAGESGLATFGAVAALGVVLLARARVWRTDPAVPVTEHRPLAPVA